MDLLFPWRQQRRPRQHLPQQQQNDLFLPPLEPGRDMNGGDDLNGHAGAAGERERGINGNINGAGLAAQIGAIPRFWNEWNNNGAGPPQAQAQIPPQPRPENLNGAIRRRDQGRDRGRDAPVDVGLNHFINQEEKLDMESPLRQMLDALNMAIFPHDLRLASVIQAAQILDHRDRTKHSHELQLGAARILYQKLAVALTLQQQTSNYTVSATVTGTTAQFDDMDSMDDRTGNAKSTNNLPYSYRRYSLKKNSTSNKRDGSTVGGISHSNNTNHAYHAADSIAMQRIRSSRSPDASDADYEIALLTSCLEMVHRATQQAIESTWHDVGLEALPILIKVMERPFVKIQAATERADRQHQSGSATERAIAIATNRETKMAVQKVTKILAVYSLIPEAKVAMASSPGLLATLVKITDTHNMNRLSSAMRPPPISSSVASASVTSRRSTAGASSTAGTFVSSASSVASYSTAKTTSSNSSATTFATSMSSSGANGIRGSTSGYGLYMNEATRFNAIATLTNLAAAEPNRMIMLAEPNLVNNIARVVHNERSDVARRCSALAIMNLSTGDSEYVPELAGNDLLLETLIKLLKDEALVVRRNAAIALFNVACADQNTVKLVQYKNGSILEIIVQLISNDEYYRNSEVDGDLGSDELNNQNYNNLSNELRTNVAEALFNISCSSVKQVTDHVANHPGLLEALAVTLKNQHVNRDVKKYCATILRRMAEIIHTSSNQKIKRKPSSSTSDSSHQVLLNALVKASVWTRTPCIADAFLLQARVPENRIVMIHHHGLLKALSKLALNVGGGESDRVRSAAVSAIEFLALVDSERAHMAKNEGIMMALTRASYGKRDAQVKQANIGSLAEDDHSMTDGSSLRIQDTLKNLVDAM